MLVVAASMAARADQPEHPVAPPGFDLGPMCFTILGWVNQPRSVMLQYIKSQSNCSNLGGFKHPEMVVNE